MKFDKEEHLQDALNNKITIFEQRYIVEKYVFKPRVIKCDHCQKYGHIARICRSETSVCGKCRSKEHDTENCTVEEDEYKCFHCDGNHRSGDKTCLVHQTVEEDMKNRFQYGK